MICTSKEMFTLFTGFTEKKGIRHMLSAKSSQRGLQTGWTRATFILRSDYLEKVKAAAYWERKSLKEVVDEALGAYLKGRRIKTRRKA